MAWNQGLDGPAWEIAADLSPQLRVMAGPGTGKTFAMKRRVARLLEEGADPKRILAVTFTRTAADDLVKELRGLGVDGCEDIEAGTLHAFCFKLLSKAEVFDVLDRFPRPLLTFKSSGVLHFEAAPMLADIRDNVFGNNRKKSKRIQAFEAAWARLQSEDPGWATDEVDKAFHEQLIEWLKFHDGMLLGELVYLALLYLRENPMCPERAAFDHVIVDEYQDLNKSEQAVLDLLAGDTGNIVVVGDEDQSIYSFRYAHKEGILQFPETHPFTADKNLVACRRCPTRVVDMADSLIRFNHPGEGRRRLLPSDGNPEGEVNVVQWATLEEEMSGIAQWIESLVASGTYQPNDILVLSPRRPIGYGIRDRLNASGVIAHSYFYEQELEEEAAQIAFSYLRLLTYPQDRVALRFLLGQGSSTWLAGQYAKVREACVVTGLSPWDLLDRVHSGAMSLSGIGRVLDKFVTIKQNVESLRAMELTDLLNWMFPEGEDWTGAFRRASFGLVEEEPDKATVAKVFAELHSEIIQPEAPTAETGYVRIMSLHKSKGLTSRAVFVVGCIDGLIPTLDEDDEDTQEQRREKLEEQRRAFYVALTRCKDLLVLSSAASVNTQLMYKMRGRIGRRDGASSITVASRFMRELGARAPRSVAGRSVLARLGATRA